MSEPIPVSLRDGNIMPWPQLRNLYLLFAVWVASYISKSLKLWKLCQLFNKPFTKLPNSKTRLDIWLASKLIWVDSEVILNHLFESLRYFRINPVLTQHSVSQLTCDKMLPHPSSNVPLPTQLFYLHTTPKFDMLPQPCMLEAKMPDIPCGIFSIGNEPSWHITIFM